MCENNILFELQKKRTEKNRKKNLGRIIWFIIHFYIFGETGNKIL